MAKSWQENGKENGKKTLLTLSQSAIRRHQRSEIHCHFLPCKMHHILGASASFRVVQGCDHRNICRTKALKIPVRKKGIWNRMIRMNGRGSVCAKPGYLSFSLAGRPITVEDLVRWICSELWTKSLPLTTSSVSLRKTTPKMNKKRKKLCEDRDAFVKQRNFFQEPTCEF